MLQGLLPFTQKTETVLCQYRRHVSDQLVFTASPWLFPNLKTIAVAVPNPLPPDTTLTAYVGKTTDEWCYTLSDSLYTITKDGYQTTRQQICRGWICDDTFMSLQEHWALRVQYWASPSATGANGIDTWYHYESFCNWMMSNLDNDPTWLRRFIRNYRSLHNIRAMPQLRPFALSTVI